MKAGARSKPNIRRTPTGGFRTDSAVSSYVESRSRMSSFTVVFTG